MIPNVNTWRESMYNTRDHQGRDELRGIVLQQIPQTHHYRLYILTKVQVDVSSGRLTCIYLHTNCFLKRFFIISEEDFPISIEQDAVLTLQELLIEQIVVDQGRFPKSILPSSTKFPPISSYPNINLFVELVVGEDYTKCHKWQLYSSLETGNQGAK